MVTLPAFVWRGGFLRRALIIGGVVGSCLGALAWLDSGFLVVGLIVTVAVGGFFGLWMPRRMTRYWPGSQSLTADERVEVARTARRGERITDARLAQAVIDYSRGLHASAEKSLPWRWLFVVVLAVAVGTALWDGVFGSWGNAIASAVYLAALLLELFWFPKRRDALLANADRAADIAGQVPESS